MSPIAHLTVDVLSPVRPAVACARPPHAQDPDTHEVVLCERGQRMAEMIPAVSRVLHKHKEYVFEVESPGRHLFLRAGYRAALNRWIAGLQILAGLPNTVPWPEEFGACRSSWHCCRV